MKRAGLRYAAFLTCAIVWLILNAISLTRFPPMHADEAWLASQTRSILQERSLGANAGFFHITDHSPHAIRLLFNALQAPFVSASWSLTSVRLLSLFCALAGILFALMIGKKIFNRSTAVFFFAAGLAFDPLYLVSSHFARPEIVLCAALMGGLALHARQKPGYFLREILLGTVIGLSIGLHANSLLVALGLGAVYAVDLLFGPDRKIALKRLMLLVGVTAIWAAAWVGASRLLSPAFPRAYAEFGSRYGVGESILVKALRFPAFYDRLFDRVTGTYYLPPLRVTLLLFASAAVAGLMLVVNRLATRRYGAASALMKPFAMFVGVNLGLLLIGKYSQPSAVLLLPSGYWLVAAVLEDVGERPGRHAVRPGRHAVRPGRSEQAPAVRAGRTRSGIPLRRLTLRRITLHRPAPAAITGRAPSVIAAILIGALCAITVTDAIPWLNVRYDRYIRFITSHIPAGASVLASPNTAFAFDHGQLHAFNDLAVLDEKDMAFSDYIESFDIAYILYPDELDVIYAERPLWNDMYGNVASYYLEMQEFIEQECEIATVYEEPVFALRILRYQEKYDARLTIYRVTGPEN